LAEEVRLLDNKKFKQSSNIEVLLLTGGEYNLNRYEYDRFMRDIYHILIKYYDPVKIGVKNHPNFPIVKLGWEDNCTVIDEKVPANLLCYTAKIVIAYESSVLYEAADIGVSAISIAHIIPSTLDGQGNNVEQYLLTNSKSKKITFPKSINELNNLISYESSNRV
jgi:hypothetical protein